MERPCPERTSPESKPRNAPASSACRRTTSSLDLTRGAETFGSTTRVRFTATAGASTFIDAITKTVHSVTLNGTALDVDAVNDGVRIQLADLQEQNEPRRRRRRAVHEHR